jgi:hypothetical protein
LSRAQDKRRQGDGEQQAGHREVFHEKGRAAVRRQSPCYHHLTPTFKPILIEPSRAANLIDLSWCGQSENQADQATTL